MLRFEWKGERQGDPHSGQINLISRRFTILGSAAANPRISHREQKSGREQRGQKNTVRIRRLG